MVDAKDFPKYTPDPMLATLPKHLKDPKNYFKIKKLLLETLATTCSHSDMSEWVTCVNCQIKAQERRQVMKKLGFQSVPQYMKWQKTMDIIIGGDRVSFRKYND